MYVMLRITSMLTKLATLSTVFSVHLKIMQDRIRTNSGIRKNSLVNVTLPEAST